MNNVDICSSYNGIVTKILSEYLRIYQLDNLPIYLFLTLAHENVRARLGDTIQCQKIYIQSIPTLGVVLTYCPMQSIARIVCNTNNSHNHISHILDIHNIERFISHPTYLIFFTRFILKLGHKLGGLFPFELLLGEFSYCIAENHLYELSESTIISSSNLLSFNVKLFDSRILSSIMQIMNPIPKNIPIEQIDDHLILVSDLNHAISSTLTENEFADTFGLDRVELFGMLAILDNGMLIFQDSTGSIPILIDCYDPQDMKHFKNGLCHIKNFRIIHRKGNGILFCKRQNLSCFARKTKHSHGNAKRIILDTIENGKNHDIILSGIEPNDSKARSSISISFSSFNSHKLFILSGYVYEFYNSKSFIYIDHQSLNPNEIEILKCYRKTMLNSFTSIRNQFDENISCFGVVTMIKRSESLVLTIKDMNNEELNVHIRNDNPYYDLISLICDYHVVDVNGLMIYVWLKRLKESNFSMILYATFETQIYINISDTYCYYMSLFHHNESFDNLKSNRDYFFNLYKSQPNHPTFYICQITRIYELLYEDDPRYKFIEKENNINPCTENCIQWRLDVDAQDGTGKARLAFYSFDHIKMILSLTTSQFKDLLQISRKERMHSTTRIQFTTDNDHLLANWKQYRFWRITCDHDKEYWNNSDSIGSFDDTNSNIIVKPVNIENIKFLTNTWKTRMLSVVDLRKCTLDDVYAD